MTNVELRNPLTTFVVTEGSSQGLGVSWMLVPLQKVLMGGSMNWPEEGEGV